MVDFNNRDDSRLRMQQLNASIFQQPQFNPFFALTTPVPEVQVAQAERLAARDEEPGLGPATQATEGRIARITTAIDQMSAAMRTLSTARNTAGEITTVLKNLRDDLELGFADVNDLFQPAPRPEPRLQTRVIERREFEVDNAAVLGNISLKSSDRIGDLNEGNGVSLEFKVNRQTTVVSATADDTVGDLINQIQATTGTNASLDKIGRLSITAPRGQYLEVSDLISGSMAALGLVTDETTFSSGTTTTTQTVTDNALVTGTKDLREVSSEQDFSLTSAQAGVKIQVGDNEAVTISRNDVASLSDLVTRIDEIAGLTAQLDSSGQLQLEALNGETLDIRSTNGEMLDVLGLTSTGTESIDSTRTVTDNAAIEGTVNIRDLASLEDLAGVQTDRSFSVDLASAGSPTTITVSSGATAQDLLNDLNAVSNVSASFTDAGALRVEATDGSTLELTDQYGSLLNDFGITENGTNIVTTAREDIPFNDQTTGTIDISNGRLQDLAGVSEGDTINLQVGGSDALTYTVGQNDTSATLLSALNGVANVTASLTPDGFLDIQTDDGSAFSLENLNGSAVQGLGITDNIRVNGDQPAIVTGTVDLGGGQLRNLANVDRDDAFSVTVNGTTTNITISNSTRANDLAQSISAIDGATASINGNGQLVVQGEGTNRVELRDGVGAPLEGLGISLNDTESVSFQAPPANATVTGSESFSPSARLRDISSAFETGQLQLTIDYEVAGVPTTDIQTVSFNRNWQLSRAVSEIDGVPRVSASLNADGEVQIVADDPSYEITLGTIGSDVATPLGLPTGQTFGATPGGTITEDRDYASADPILGNDTRTVRVDSAEASTTQREEAFQIQRGIVQASASEREVVTETQDDTAFASVAIGATRRSVINSETVKIERFTESDRARFERESEKLNTDREKAIRKTVNDWEAARRTIDSAMDSALDKGATLIAGGQLRLTTAEGGNGSQLLSAGNSTVEGLGLDNLSELLADRKQSEVLDALDLAIGRSIRTESNVTFAFSSNSIELGFADTLLGRLADEQQTLLDNNSAREVAQRTGQSLATVQLATAANRANVLRGF